MNEQLKPLPCPFCGHIGLQFESGSTYRWGIASCAGCGATCGEVRRNYPDDGQWHAEAVEAWSRRAQPAQAVPLLTDAEIDALYAKSDLQADPGSDYGCGFYSGARWAEQAVRAKMGVAVPMTSEDRPATGERIASQLRVEEVGAALIRRARDIVVGHQKGSISLVQRHLRIGYNTAAKLLVALEHEGVVSPQRNNGQREVLVLPDISGIVGKEGA